MSSSGEFHVYHNFPRATAKRSRIQSREKETVRGNFYSDDQKQLLSSATRKPKRREQPERTKPNRRRHVRSATQQVSVQGIHPSQRVKFNPLRKVPALDDIAPRSRCHQRILERNSRVNRVSWGHLRDKDVNMLRNCQLKEDRGCRMSPRRSKSKSKSKSRGKEAKKWSDLDAVAREMVMRPEGERLPQNSRNTSRFAGNDMLFPRSPVQNENTRMQPQPSAKTRTDPRKRNKPINWRARVKSQPSDLTRIRKKEKDMTKSNRRGIIMYSHEKDLDQRRHKPEPAHDRPKSYPLNLNNALPNKDRRVPDERYLRSGRHNSLSDSEHMKEGIKPHKRKKTKKKRDRFPKRGKNYKHRPFYKPDPREVYVFDDRFENGHTRPKPNLGARRAQRKTIEIVFNDNRLMLGAVDESIYKTRVLVNPNNQWLSNPNTPNRNQEYNPADNQASNLLNLQRGEHNWEAARDKPSHPHRDLVRSRESPERQPVDRDIVGSSGQKWKEYLQNRNLNRNGENLRDFKAHIRQKDQWHSQASHHRSFEEENHRERNINDISIAEDRPTKRVPRSRAGIGFVYPQRVSQWQDVSDISPQDQREYKLDDHESKRTELQPPDRALRNMNVRHASEKTDNGSALDSGWNRGRPTENVNRIPNNNPWRELWPNISIASYSTTRNQEKKQEHAIRRGQGNERASVQASLQSAHDRAKNDSQTNTNNRSKEDHSTRRHRVSLDADESTTQSSSSSDSPPRNNNFLNSMWMKDEKEPTPEQKEITHIEINLSPNENIAIRDRPSIYRTRNSATEEKVEQQNLSPSRTAVSAARTVEEYYDSMSESVPSVPSNNNEQIDSDYAFAVQLHLAGDDEHSSSHASSPLSRNRRNPSNDQVQADENFARSLQEELFSGLPRTPSLSYPRSRRLAVTPIPSEEDFLRFRRIPNYSLPSPEPFRSSRFLFRSFPRGAEQSAIDELPTRKYVLRGRYTDDEKIEGDSKISKEAENETVTCAVCMETFQAGEDLKTLPCMHFYHTVCIDQWLLQNRTCPVCKYDITENDLVSL